MRRSIEQAEKEVQRSMERAQAIVDAGTGKSLDEVEQELWSAMMALGRAFIALVLARRASAPRAASYEHGKVEYQLDARRPRRSEVGTRFGKVLFCRPVARPVLGVGRADLPVDRELGLCSRFTLATAVSVVRLCAMMAFGTARQTFEEFHEWAPSSRTTLRMVDAVGARARGFLEATPAPADDGEVLVIQADGRGAPMITETELERRRQPHRRKKGTARHRRRDARREHPRERRKKGDKSKNAKVAFVGVIYTLRNTLEGVEGPINKELIATFESHEALFRWLVEHARRRGYGTKRTLFLGDGSEHLWRCQQTYLPDAEVCIDWFHVVEKLWEAGGCLHREGSDELTKWVEKQKTELRDGRQADLLENLRNAYRAIPKTGPGNKGRRQRLGKVIRYLDEHAHRMRFAELRRDDLDIGTGAVEGAVRNLVGIRFDGPGMRWGRERSELLMHLRCIFLNGQWEAFRSYLARCQLSLPAQPTPARPHSAIAKKAA
jgi:hypothetical protein